MKLTQLIFLLFSCFSLFSYGQSGNCANMRTGTFIYLAGDTRVEIKRTETKQIEKVGRYKFVGEVRWISETEYLLVMTKIPFPGCLRVGDVVRITMSECDEDSYVSTIPEGNCPGASITIMKIK